MLIDGPFQDMPGIFVRFSNDKGYRISSKPLNSRSSSETTKPEPLVRPRRLELPRVLPHSDLNAARLPIPPRPQLRLSHCILN